MAILGRFSRFVGDDAAGRYERSAPTGIVVQEAPGCAVARELATMAGDGR